MGTPARTSRIDFSDAIRAYASVSVVVLHVLFSDDWKYYPAPLWWFTDLLHALAKPAVPLFVMLSGAFLLDPAKEFSIGKFWMKRASRVLLPFLAWTPVYAAWSIYHDHAWPLAEFFPRFINNQVAFHLWFVYMLMGLYLALPVMRRFVAAATRWEIFYFMGLWLVAACIVPLFADSIGDTQGYLVMATGFTGYFMAGYWLWKLRLPEGSAKYLLAGCVALALGNAVIAHVLAARSDLYLDDDESFLNDLGPTVAILGFLVFLFFRSLRYDRGIFANRGIAGAVSTLSSASYGMYLGHVLVLMMLGSGMIFGWHLHIGENPWLGIPFEAFIGVVATLALLLALSKVPVLRVLAPMTKPHGKTEAGRGD